MERAPGAGTVVLSLTGKEQNEGGGLLISNYQMEGLYLKQKRFH